jgi:hypothetical protein
MAARQLWLFLTTADVGALCACLEERDPGVRASWGRYLRGDEKLLLSDPAALERRESLPGERRLYLFHQRHSQDVVAHLQPEGPFAGWAQLDEERSDCLVLRLPDEESADGVRVLRPARLVAHVVTWRGGEKERKRTAFSSWAGRAVKALLGLHPPTAVPFMRLGQDALSQARAGALRLSYLYRPIGHEPLPRAARQPPAAGAITAEDPSLDDALTPEETGAGLVSLGAAARPALPAAAASPAAASPPAASSASEKSAAPAEPSGQPPTSY